MGDRGNILVSGYGSAVYLYSHWGGSTLPAVLQRALRRRLRWRDTSYLTRIIFCEMIKGDESGETGFGISSEMGDNEHDILVVDTEDQCVLICSGVGAGPYLKKYSFEEFCSMDLLGKTPEDLA